MKKYWRSLDEYHDKPDKSEELHEKEHKNAVLELFEDEFADKKSSRRSFLKVFGFSVTSAAIAASCERPVQKAIPYVIAPEEITPGKSIFYASSFFDGKDFCSILVKNRDGRPIKIEGNDLDPISRGGTTARVQASVLSLYDDARYKAPLDSGLESSWEEVDDKIMSQLNQSEKEGKDIVLLTSTIISPSTRRLIDEFAMQYSNFRWISYDAVSASGIREAADACYGKPVLPDYHFDKVRIIVSFGANFLDNWILPVRFIRDYADGRKLDGGQKNMNRHIQLESSLSLTGSNADERIIMKPSEEKLVLAGLYNEIASRTGNTTISIPSSPIDVSSIAKELIDHKSESLVVSGSNDPECQILINGINEMLGNTGSTVDFAKALNLLAGNDQAFHQLIGDMENGKVGALMISGANPVYDYPDSVRFINALENVGTTVSFATSPDETTAYSNYICPIHHYLESWNDSAITDEHLYLAQPVIRPIFNTRSFQDSLLKYMGSEVTFMNYMRNNWKEQYFNGSGDFKSWWNQTLQKGVLTLPFEEDKPSFISSAIGMVNISGSSGSEGFELECYESIQLGSGQHANNPWLQELPDPVTKHCWENVLHISVEDGKTMGLSDGDLVSLNDIKIPVLLQPGQAKGTCAIALGYGKANTGKVADGIGVNAYPLIRLNDGRRMYNTTAIKIEPVGENRTLALTQTHHSMEGRPIIRETNLDKYLEDPASGNELHEEYESHHETLYPEVDYDGFHWGLAVDLNACVGCSTCVIACQAENNIPVVGKSEVHRRRAMHWMKIDRYYSDEPENPKVSFQPVMCQHCDNAPCENVCPVSATNHSSEGINQMSYNRCIGTKYCINNCPYRVRRFNWFKYAENEEFDYNINSELGKMVLNPDVTVRSRGVVEKCSFCVQRIQEKKMQAKLENRKLQDGEIEPACVQACPAGALVFGDLNDKTSKISMLKKDPRNYHLLEQLHTLPSVGYLTKVRNEKNK